jgi:hypothetical protein
MWNRKLQTVALALVLPALLGLLATGAQARVTPFSAVMRGGNFTEFSQTNIAEGRLQISDRKLYEGDPSAEATYDGDGRNGYSRGIWNVHWQDGDSVTYSAAYFLPVGFTSDVQGEVDLMRWDDWTLYPNPDETDWGGIGIYGSDHKARLLRFGHGLPNETLVGPFSLPEGQWFTLEVRQHFSDGPGAFSEVLLDGQPIGSSTRPNTYGRPIERIRFGIVAIAEGVQRKPLHLWFDNAKVRPESTSVGDAPVSTHRHSRHRHRQHRHGRGMRIANARAVG